MLPNPRLAARYAKSILGLSIEKGELENVYKDMLFLRETCRSSREFVNFLHSPVIKPDKKGKILDAILGGKISAITTAFIKLLLHKERESYLPEIAPAFIDQYKTYKGIRTVKLTTAVAVDEDVRKAILQKVQTGHDGQRDRAEYRSERIAYRRVHSGDRRPDGRQ